MLDKTIKKLFFNEIVVGEETIFLNILTVLQKLNNPQIKKVEVKKHGNKLIIVRRKIIKLSVNFQKAVVKIRVNYYSN